MSRNFVPQGLLPRCIPAFDSNNFWFYRQSRNICLIAARRHLTLLTKECRMKIKQFNKELANHKKNLEEHCTPETFRINSMALSLESVLARRRANKFRNSHVNTSNVTATDNLNTFSNNFTRTQTSTHRRNRHKRKPRNISPTIRLDTTSVINLSQTPLSHDESSVLARGLTFFPHPDVLIGQNYQLTLMTLHDRCDLLSTFMITTITLLTLLIIKITHSIIKAHGLPPLTETQHLTLT